MLSCHQHKWIIFHWMLNFSHHSKWCMLLPFGISFLTLFMYNNYFWYTWNELVYLGVSNLVWRCWNWCTDNINAVHIGCHSNTSGGFCHLRWVIWNMILTYCHILCMVPVIYTTISQYSGNIKWSLVDHWSFDWHASIFLYSFIYTIIGKGENKAQIMLIFFFHFIVFHDRWRIHAIFCTNKVW